jgi:hypothetical protein
MEHLVLTPSRSNAEAFHRISRISSAATQLGLVNRRLQPLGHVSGPKLLIIHWPLGQRRNPATLRTAQQQGTQKGTPRVPDGFHGPSLGSSTWWAPGNLVISYRGVGEACALLRAQPETAGLGAEAFAFWQLQLQESAGISIFASQETSGRSFCALQVVQ